MSTYLGIDVGTSGTKTLVARPDGTVLATAAAEHPSYHPKPGWSEQAPEDWWQSTVQSTQKALAKAAIDPKEVKGIGLSGQMHGSVFLDGEGRVLRRALLWNDQRTAAQCAEIESKAGGRRELIQMVSNPAFTGFTAPKILWVREHEPQIYEQIRQVLLPKDYVRLRLTGEYATEVSDASGTLLLDVTNRRWSQPLLDRLGIDKALLPRCYESEEVTGKLSNQAATELGLPPGIPVVGGAGDQAASAVGNGIVRPGILSATLGTSGVVFGHADEVQTDPEGRVHTLCHAVRGKWHVMGVVLSAAGSLEWYRQKLGQLEADEAAREGVDVYDHVVAQAATVPPGAEGLFFLPYLTGERHPHSDPDARGAWIGLTVRHGREHLTRAIIEGATFAMRDCLAVLHEMNVPVSQVRLSGGGAKSLFWRQLQADVYGCQVATINTQEGPAFGVALLAMVGAGEYKSVPEACAATIRLTEERQPNPEAAATYQRLFDQYQRFYPLLKDEFPRLAQLSRS